MDKDYKDEVEFYLKRLREMFPYSEMTWFIFNNEDERAKRLAEYQPGKMVICEITKD